MPECSSARWREGTWALPVAVLVGKPVGILFGAGLAVVAGLHLPHRVGWRDLLAIGFIAAIGFSVGLFFDGALSSGPVAIRRSTWACC